MYCSETGKIIYNTKHDADLVINHKKQRRRNMKNIRPNIRIAYSYRCGFCGKWHLAGK